MDFCRIILFEKISFNRIIEVYNLQPSSELLGEKSQILIQFVYIILKHYR